MIIAGLSRRENQTVNANHLSFRSSIKKAPVPPTKAQPPRKWNRDTDEVYVRKFNVVIGMLLLYLHFIRSTGLNT
jgi:hypothetical protein